MLGLESFLMQTGLVEQINATATTANLLISTLSGIVIYVITNIRKVKKEELTERDKWIMDALKVGQMTSQKLAENIGQNKTVLQALYNSATTDEQRKWADENIIPILKQETERLQKANQQATMVKGIATNIFGEKGDVDQDPTIPRESLGISQSLRQV